MHLFRNLTSNLEYTPMEITSKTNDGAKVKIEFGVGKWAKLSSHKKFVEVGRERITIVEENSETIELFDRNKNKIKLVNLWYRTNI